MPGKYWNNLIFFIRNLKNIKTTWGLVVLFLYKYEIWWQLFLYRKKNVVYNTGYLQGYGGPDLALVSVTFGPHPYTENFEGMTLQCIAEFCIQ